MEKAEFGLSYCINPMLAMFLLLFLFLPVPRGVIQNGARVRSQALFPVIRPLPVSPVGSRTSAIR